MRGVSWVISWDRYFGPRMKVEVPSTLAALGERTPEARGVEQRGNERGFGRACETAQNKVFSTTTVPARALLARM